MNIILNVLNNWLGKDNLKGYLGEKMPCRDLNPRLRFSKPGTKLWTNFEEDCIENIDR
jgi:hypothetical protein